MAETFEFDVFLSHSSADKPAVRELAERLKADGLRVWFDEWEIAPGDMIGLKVVRGLEQSRRLVLVMTKNFFKSEWAKYEHHTVQFSDPTNSQRRLVPLWVSNCEIPFGLRPFLYIDFRKRTDSAYQQLFAACRPEQAEPRKAHAPQPPAAKPATAKSAPKPSGQQPSFFRNPRRLKGHTDVVWSVAITSDGQRALSGSDDNTIKHWDLETRQCLATLEGHTNTVWSVALAPDGKRALSGSGDNTLKLWDLETRQCLATLEGHTNSVRSVALTPDGRRAVSGSNDDTLKLWDLETGQCVATLKGHTDSVLSVALAPDGRRVVSGSDDETLKLWDLETGQCLTTFKGHTDSVCSVALAPDGRRAISGSDDHTLKLWDLETGLCVATLEGHTEWVWSVAITLDGRRALSGSWDNTLKLWDLANGQCLQTLKADAPVNSVCINPLGLVAAGMEDGTIFLYELADLDAAMPASAATSYTNAKVLLVGDSGVGKSGLAIRLTEDRFEATDSTDGVEASQIKLTTEKDAQSPNEWATQLQLPHEGGGADGFEREIWLWDFAGQSDYRLIHQLYMDETALAVFVFNPQSSDPFDGLGQWDRDLHRAARRPFKKLLVAGRCDRGGLTVSEESVERFRTERGFAAYLPTSAKTGGGCPDLRRAIIENIDWKGIPWTSSPRIFKVLKDEIIKLKDSGIALLRMGELKQQLEMRLPGEVFTVEELRAVTGLLAGPGVVWQLEFGDFVLLQPERINAYAAAAIRKVRAHTDELGYIFEEDILAGDLNFADMRRLPRDDEAIVLRAMNQTFVERGLCLREQTDKGALLIFPSYFKRERPEQDDHPAACVTYRFNGPLDEIYATLVVCLHHTPAFEKDQIWRFAADFKTLAGKRAGLKMTKKPEGAAEIVVYFGPDVVEDTRALFIGYIHEHLMAKAQDVVRERHYVCPHCGTAVENRGAVRKRLERNEKDIICGDCEKRVPLWDLIEEKFASEEFRQRVRDLERAARASIDNESRELILVGHAFATAGEAGQIFRPTPNSDWGLDGEIEFKDDRGQASGQRVYLQLKSGDSYLHTRKGDDKEIFAIKNPRHAEYWQAHKYPVMLVIRASSSQIRWMNVTDYLKKHGAKARQIEFVGEPFTALNLVRMRDRLLVTRS